MRAIAEKIEYSPTTIYLHFKDKAELLECVCEETFAVLVRKLESVLSRPTDPLVMLRAGMRAYIDFGLENPNHYRVTMMMPHPHGPHGDDYLRPDSMGYRAFQILCSGVEAALSPERERAQDVTLAAQTLWAGAHGITSLLIVHPKFPWADREQLINSMLDTLLMGLDLGLFAPQPNPMQQ
jgi:AcrR family transcriptional regulator